jgi:GT2 family glycosyltransferase
MRDLTVVIPSKKLSNLVPCLKAVERNEDSIRMIVVDDGLDDGGFDLEAAFNQLDIVQGEKPFIFSRNCNLGIAAAGDDDVVLLNDDALLESPGGFSLLQREAEANPKFGIIGATTNVTGQWLQQRQKVGLRQVPHIAFVAVLIPRRTIDKIGLLDERYCIDYGCEDRDYCESVTRAGLYVGVHDDCFVDHASLRSTYRGDPRAPKSFKENQKLFDAKWGKSVVA